MLTVEREKIENGGIGAWLKRSANLGRIVKYGIIGVGAVLIDVGMFLFLDRRGVVPLAANSVSVALAVVFSFAMNAKFTFKVRDKIGRRLAAFGVVNLLGFLLGQSVILLLTAPDLTQPDVAKLLSLPLVVGTQYVLNSNWTFVTDA